MCTYIRDMVRWYGRSELQEKSFSLGSRLGREALCSLAQSAAFCGEKATASGFRV